MPKQEDIAIKNNIMQNIQLLPTKDIKQISHVIIDYDHGSIGSVHENALPASVWNELGDVETKKLLKKAKTQNKPYFIIINPAWENNKPSQYTIFHEVGHVVFYSLPKGETPERLFWVKHTNIKDISHKGTQEQVESGRGSDVLEYFADHYARYHTNQPIPKEEKDWFDKRYNKP